MKSISFPSIFGDKYPFVFFLLLFLYQLLLTFQGLDLADEGFNATFYDEIFKTPENVQYNFMFWLSGVIGGGFDYFFPSLGLWGLRLLGVLTSTATIFISYNLLKKYLTPQFLKLGLLIVLLSLNNNIKIFHYNYLSAFLYVVTVSFLLNGLKRNSLVKIFLSGVFIALDFFTRLPSIINIGLIIVIFYHGYINNFSFSKQIKSALSFIGGFCMSVISIVVLMKLTGQLDHFIYSLKLVSQMGSGREESSYGLIKLLKNFYSNYTSALIIAVFFIISIIALALVINLLKKRYWYKKWLIDVLKYFILSILFILIIVDVFHHYRIILLLSGLSLIAGFLIIISSADKELKVLAITGCFILLAYPLGSSDSLSSAGMYSLWIIFPIALNFFFNIKSVNNHLTILGDKENADLNILLKEEFFNKIKIPVIIIFLFAGLYQTYYYPFFDHADRKKMRYSINNKYLKGIYTTKGKADALNELLKESAKYIKANDYVLAYHSIPLFYYITKTKPSLHNSMPWLYPGHVFESEIQLMVTEKKNLPVVVSQLRKTVLEASNWPDPAPLQNSEWEKITAAKDIYFNEFLKKYQYKEVWRNSMFRILVPPKDSL